MKHHAIRRTAVALGLAGLVFGATFGLAASLDVNGAGFGAGTEAVAACDSDGVTVDYTTAYDETLDAYEVTEVAIGDIDGCDGETAKATLDGASGNNLGAGSAAVSGGTDVSVAIDVSASNIAAADVAKIAVAIG